MSSTLSTPRGGRGTTLHPAPLDPAVPAETHPLPLSRRATDHRGQAISDYQRALELQPIRWAVRLRLAEILVASARHPEAVPHLERLRQAVRHSFVYPVRSENGGETWYLICHGRVAAALPAPHDEASRARMAGRSIITSLPGRPCATSCGAIPT